MGVVSISNRNTDSNRNKRVPNTPYLGISSPERCHHFAFFHPSLTLRQKWFIPERWGELLMFIVNICQNGNSLYYDSDTELSHNARMSISLLIMVMYARIFWTMGKCKIIKKILGVNLPCSQMDTEMKPVFTVIWISLVIQQIAFMYFTYVKHIFKSTLVRQPFFHCWF